MPAKAETILTAVDRASAVFASVEQRVGSLGKTFDRVGSLGTKFIGVLALGGATAGIAKLVSEIDDLDEAAQGLGLKQGAVALSEYRQAAKENGVQLEQLDKAFAALASRVQDAIGGNKEARDSFDRFGVTLRDDAGNVKSFEQVLADLANRAKGLDDSMTKTNALADIFGQKLGPKLAAFLNQGGDALRRTTGLTSEMVEQATKAQKEIDKLDAAWVKFKLTAGGGLATLINAALVDVSPEAKIRQITAALQQAEQELNTRSQAGAIDTFISRLLGGSDADIEKAQEKVSKLKSALRDLNNLGIDRFTSGVNALRSADLREALPDKEDVKSIEANQQALASYVHELESTIDASRGLTEVQKVLRAFKVDQFGQVVGASKEAQQLLLSLASQADALNREKEQLAQFEAFSNFTNQLSDAIEKTKELSNAELAEQFIRNNPRAVQTDQQREVLRGLAEEADRRKQIADLIKQTQEQDELTIGTHDALQQQNRDLDQTIIDLSGISDEMRKIRLTGRLEELLSKGAQFTPEQLDKIVKGIGGINDQLDTSVPKIQEFGGAFTDFLGEAVLNVDKLDRVMGNFAENLKRLLIKQNLTDPLNDFFKTLRGNSDFIDLFRGVLGLGLKGGGSSAGAPSGTGFSDDLAGGSPSGIESRGGGPRITQNISFQGPPPSTQNDMNRLGAQMKRASITAITDARKRKPGF